MPSVQYTDSAKARIKRRAERTTNFPLDRPCPPGLTGSGDVDISCRVTPADALDRPLPTRGSGDGDNSCITTAVPAPDRPRPPTLTGSGDGDGSSQKAPISGSERSRPHPLRGSGDSDSSRQKAPAPASDRPVIGSGDGDRSCIPSAVPIPYDSTPSLSCRLCLSSCDLCFSSHSYTGCSVWICVCLEGFS